MRRDRAWANFVVGTGLAFTPDQWLGLTIGQRAAVAAESKRLNRKG